ncbi:isochorismate synthase [Alloyangia pacifica]|uniref:isochorismate synthase n=1 Tax=Alloyangia pacifica TaxID=311180 RepID=A0A1I6QLG7_9RHOB|nr:isochorismate synthase [Alloyangia pacifica]SDF92538.1 isochorismate synthase [Alloyangia pacifica]SFS53304.1 isochorismate synthase [Alloyangia pacifica]
MSELAISLQSAASCAGLPLRLGSLGGVIEEAQSDTLANLARTHSPFDRRMYGAFPFAREKAGWLYGIRPDSHQADLNKAKPARALDLCRLPSQDAYGEAVAATAAQVADAANPLRKAVLARALDLRTDRALDPFAVAKRLGTDPHVTAYCLPLPGRRAETRWLVGATPELLLRKTGGDIRSHPLAGSARRREDAREDADARAALLGSEKDNVEHRVVVEYIHDILAPYCSALSVPDAPQLDRTASMWHLGTCIDGTLRDADTPCLELLAALHPTPAVAGAPLREALQAIAEAEPFDRDFYAGTLGWVNEANDGEWHVTLRCAMIEGRAARLFAGAGIVAASDPLEEVAETRAKFIAMRRALGIAESL